MKSILFIFAVAASQISCFHSLSQTVSFTRMDTGTIAREPGFGRGCMSVDSDNDGDLDLYIGASNGMWPNRPNPYYRNERNGRFSKVTYGIIPKEIYEINFGGIWGDYDNDGDWDMFTEKKLYTNDGFGNAEKVETVTSLDGGDWSWIDYDSDSYLDIFNTWTKNHILKGSGDGTFTNVGAGSITDESVFCQAAMWSDCDNDGDMDVFNANFSDTPEEAIPDDLFINNGDGTFSSISDTSQLVADTLSSLGGSWGDYNNDGNMDLYVLHLGDFNHLFKNNGNLNFEKIIIDPPEAEITVSGGSAWGDFDNDGDLDLFVTNVRNGIFGVNPVFKQNLLFINNGDGTFVRETNGQIVHDGGCTVITNDFDNDGDLDILIVNGNLGPPSINYIYLNNGNNNNWLNIKCIGTISNKSAIGARIKAKAIINSKPVWMTREVAQITTMHAVSAPRLHFGLGDAETADSLVIRWPNGHIDVYTGIKANHFYKATEATGISVDFAATNYIEVKSSIDNLLIEDDSVVIDLSAHFHYVRGDTVPEFSGDTIRYSIFKTVPDNVINAAIYADKLHIRRIGSMAGITKLDIEAYTGFTHTLKTFYVLTTKPFTAGYGYAYQFSGDLIYYSSNPVPALDSLKCLTVSCWVCPNSLPKKSSQKIVSKGSGLLNILKDGYFSAEIPVSILGSRSLVSSEALIVNQWSHIAVTYDGDTIKLFLNGEPCGEEVYSSTRYPINTEDIPLKIWGTDEQFVYNEISGQLDDIRIWNRALTREEIAISIQGPANVSDNDLAGYWDFDEGAGEYVLNAVDSTSGKIEWFEEFNWKYSTVPVVYSSPDNTPIQVILPGKGDGTFELVQQGKQGTGVITNSSTGEFTYTPGNSVTGCDTMAYRIVKEGFVSQDVPIVIKLQITTSIKDNNQASPGKNVWFYPNPAKGLINIQSDYKKIILAILDIQGRIVYSRNIKGSQNTLDISSLSSGLYFITIKSEGMNEVGKLIKE